MNQNSTEMSEWKRDWTEKQKDLYHRALAVGHHLRRNIRDRYYILYDQCPDKQGVSAINEKFAGQLGPLEDYITKLEANLD